MKPEKIVEHGYDKVFMEYHKQRHTWKNARELNEYSSRLLTGSRVLDVGCGSGVVAEYLSERGLAVTGIDSSRKMLELARKTAPKAVFHRMDMKRIRFPPRSFDGIVSLYSIIHVPKEHHSSILKSFHRLLAPRGLLLISVGLGEYTGTEDNWLGGKMYWSHFGKETNLELIRRAGFNTIWSRPVGKGNDRHLFVLAEKRTRV